MSTIVYRGLQSCFESQVIEATILKLKVSTPCPQDFIKKTTSVELRGFSFLQSLSNTPSSPKETSMKERTTYVHPLTRRSTSSPRLSQESLELCTENLGSETGSESMDINLIFPPMDENQVQKKTCTFTDMSISSSLAQGQQCPEEDKVATRTSNNKASNARQFPPPLTTMRSCNPLRVTPHREDGRLVIKAMKTPSRNTCFRAQRSNGHLRLCLWKEHVDDDDDDHNNQHEEDIEDKDGGLQEQEQDEYDDDDDDDDDDAYMSRDINGIDLECEVQNGMEKFQMPRRCKEGGEHENNSGICNWKPLWVATS